MPQSQAGELNDNEELESPKSPTPQSQAGELSTKDNQDNSDDGGEPPLKFRIANQPDGEYMLIKIE